MSSRTEICNLALGHLGIGTEIANVDTEKSAEAAACRRFYETALKETLRAFAWPFASKNVNLGLVTSQVDDPVNHPTTEWDFQYQIPADCLMFRKILSAIRNDTHESRVPYRIAHGTSGSVIYTDMDDAVGEYTLFVEDTQRYTPDFIMALSLLIAAYIAPKITGGDPFKMGDRALRFYQIKIAQAEVSANNEEQVDQEPETPSIRARES